MGWVPLARGLSALMRGSAVCRRSRRPAHLATHLREELRGLLRLDEDDGVHVLVLLAVGLRGDAVQDCARFGDYRVSRPRRDEPRRTHFQVARLSGVRQPLARVLIDVFGDEYRCPAQEGEDLLLLLVVVVAERGQLLNPNLLHGEATFGRVELTDDSPLV